MCQHHRQLKEIKIKRTKPSHLLSLSVRGESKEEGAKKRGQLRFSKKGSVRTFFRLLSHDRPPLPARLQRHQRTFTVSGAVAFVLSAGVQSYCIVTPGIDCFNHVGACTGVTE